MIKWTKEPPAVTGVRWALSELGNVSLAILDSFSDPTDRVRYLGRLQAMRDSFKDLVAEIEAHVAKDDWGNGPRGGKRKDLSVDGVTAKKTTNWKYTWDTPVVLTEIVTAALTNQDTGEKPSDEVIADVVAAIEKYGVYDPRATALYEGDMYDAITVQDVRKREQGRTTVKVTEVNPDGETGAAAVEA